MTNSKEQIEVYGTPDNLFKDIMLGGVDVIAVNQMLKKAFEEGVAGRGESTVEIGTYKGRSVHEQKAADGISIEIDENDPNNTAYVLLIVRGEDPGKGLVALAGGFKDPGETDSEAAARERSEEAAGETGELIARYKIERHPVAGDVRVWKGSDRVDGVKSDDIIAMSTACDVDLVKGAYGPVEAGDDAEEAAWVKISDLVDANLFGVKGHASMLVEAANLVGVEDQLKESFLETLNARSQNILVASEAEQKRASEFLTPKAPV